MRLRDYIALGWDQLRRRMVVTLLCTMGIAIGSAAIIVALAFGESIAHYARVQMNSFLKMDEITVYGDGSASPGGSGADAGGMTEQKIDVIRQLPHVRSAAVFQPVDYASFIVDGTKRGSLQLTGAELGKLEEFGYELGQGSFSDQDNAIVVTYSAMYDLYDTRLDMLKSGQEGANSGGGEKRQRIAYPLYQKQLTLSVYTGESNGAARFEAFPVRVVGVLKKPDGAAGYEGQKIGYISLGLAERIEQAKRSGSGAAAGNSDTQLVIKVDDPSNVAQVEKWIQKLGLRTQSNIRYQEETNAQFKIIRFIFGGAGLFILFVASISIIVAMTMSTYQRRRQIGIMKVLGANLAQIRNMFVVESALLGFIGGCFGILFSYWVIWSINIVLQRFADSEEILFIEPWILALGLFFALLTGVLSGIYPAIKASRTDALTAIKRE